MTDALASSRCRADWSRQPHIPNPFDLEQRLEATTTSHRLAGQRQALEH
jgi:hypothetical protein